MEGKELEIAIATAEADLAVAKADEAGAKLQGRIALQRLIEIKSGITEEELIAWRKPLIGVYGGKRYIKKETLVLLWKAVWQEEEKGGIESAGYKMAETAYIAYLKYAIKGVE